MVIGDGGSGESARCQIDGVEHDIKMTMEVLGITERSSWATDVPMIDAVGAQVEGSASTERPLA
jgi:hypothetical protein